MTSIQSTAALFKPIKVGRMFLQHRVVLAPLTRLRVHASHVPGPQQASYYAQRGSAPGTLLIAEGTLISHDGGGWGNVPGIYTDTQIEAWKKVTDAVHAKGSYIFLQIVALGRAADIDLLETQDPPSPYVGASAITLTGESRPPRPLTEAEIGEYISAFAKAASDAVHGACFDGVEIHAANGYLLDQFLQIMSNTRMDRWGGDVEGRAKFTREIVDAVVAKLVTALRDKHPTMAYLHVIEPRVSGSMDRIPREEGSNDFLRQIWNGGEGGEEGVVISAGGYTRESALRTAEDKGGLIAFGRLYIPNLRVSVTPFDTSTPLLISGINFQPDLPVRLQKNLALTPVDRLTYYQSGNLTPFGYNDWPFADGYVEGIDGKL